MHLIAGGDFDLADTGVESGGDLAALRITARFCLLGLQLGGALGNVIDRINQGYVTDFVKMGIPGVYYWPNYNIADAAIVTGVIGLGIYIVVDDMRNTRRAKELAVSASTVQESSPVE